ncbi:hypothetical protein BDR04DRAFT_1120781 [Suillus decipiens]|nr:hypothetical protein BDR04DRAFT_1120781 [Suillus decipiens]
MPLKNPNWDEQALLDQSANYYLKTQWISSPLHKVLLISGQIQLSNGGAAPQNFYTSREVLERHLHFASGWNHCELVRINDHSSLNSSTIWSGPKENGWELINTMGV